MTFFCSSHGRIPYTDTVQGHEVLIFMHGRPTSKELFEPLPPKRSTVCPKKELSYEPVI